MSRKGKQLDAETGFLVVVFQNMLGVDKTSMKTLVSIPKPGVKGRRTPYREDMRTMEHKLLAPGESNAQFYLRIMDAFVEILGEMTRKEQLPQIHLMGWLEQLYTRVSGAGLYGKKSSPFESLPSLVGDYWYVYLPLNSFRRRLSLIKNTLLVCSQALGLQDVAVPVTILPQTRRARCVPGSRTTGPSPRKLPGRFSTRRNQYHQSSTLGDQQEIWPVARLSGPLRTRAAQRPTQQHRPRRILDLGTHYHDGIWIFFEANRRGNTRLCSPRRAPVKIRYRTDSTTLPNLSRHVPRSTPPVCLFSQSVQGGGRFRDARWVPAEKGQSRLRPDRDHPQEPEELGFRCAAIPAGPMAQTGTRAPSGVICSLWGGQLDLPRSTLRFRHDSRFSRCAAVQLRPAGATELRFSRPESPGAEIQNHVRHAASN